MKLLVLICLSLQLLVAPVCQAAMSCGQDLAGMALQNMSGHGAHSGLATSQVPAAPDCAHCDEVSVMGDDQVLAVMPALEGAHETVVATVFILRGDAQSANTRAPPEVVLDASQSVWLRTLRIRL